MKPSPCFVSLLLFAVSCLHGGERVVQFATIDSLLAGVYEGHFPCEAVLAAGDFGLGTFEAVDGEMVVLDGKMYQVRADGSVSAPEPGATTPFAAVVRFAADAQSPVAAVEGMAGLEAVLKKKLPNLNLPYAVQVEGSFAAMKTRAPRKQAKPYPPLAEVVESQAVFERTEVEGVMVGFYLPAYVEGINVPGLHLHFLNTERDFGGHVLAFNLTEGVLETDATHQWELHLPPESVAFREAELGVDRSEALQAVEADRE